MSKHTPGPWRTERNENDLMLLGPAGGGELPISEIIGHAASPEALADARLIAAAPDLLAALEQLLHFTTELCEEIKVSKHYPSCELARMTIAQAKGGTQ